MRALAPLSAGGVFAFGWFVLIDSLVINWVEHPLDGIDARYFVPGFMASFALLAVSCLPLRALNNVDDFSSSSSSTLSCARLMLFCSFIVAFSSIGVAAALIEHKRELSIIEIVVNATGNNTTLDGADDDPSRQWIGFSAMIQCALIFLSIFLCISSRIDHAPGL